MYIVIYCYDGDIERLPNNREDFVTAYESMVEDMIDMIDCDDENFSDEEQVLCIEKLKELKAEGVKGSFYKNCDWAEVHLEGDSGFITTTNNYHCYWKVLRA